MQIDSKYFVGFFSGTRQGMGTFKRYFWGIGNVPKKQRRGNRPISGLKMRGFRLREGPDRPVPKMLPRMATHLGVLGE